MDITVDRKIRTPLYWQISDQIKEMIITCRLPDGAVLPSERTLSSMLGVHRNTVIKAYSMLKDLELIDSKHGVGYIVTYTQSENTEPDVRRKVNWSNLIKDEYQDVENAFDKMFLHFAEEKNISFSTGMPPQVYNEEEIAAEIASILNDEGRSPFYLSPYQGDLVLRQRLISFLRTKGIKAGISEVQVLSETNQALDFIVTALLKEGDCVIIEEPVSPDVYRVIELAGCQAITVPVDDDGIQCDRLEPIIESSHPKFIYVNSSFHDPTGNILSLERRKKLLELSNRYRLPVIEEDAASELYYEGVVFPTIKSMDRSENVIYIYSFALTFIPGMSMAFVVAPEKLIKSLSYLVSIRIMTLDWMTQKLLSKYISDGRYYDKVKEIAALNKKKRNLMCSYLDCLKVYGVTYTKPRGGVYIWCRLPDGVDSTDVAAKAIREEVSLFPGQVFYPHNKTGHNYIRLNYSYESEERIEEGMKRLIKVITGEFEKK